MEFTEEQRIALRRMVIDWIGEGFRTPPYEDAYYDIFEELGITEDDAWPYTLKRSESKGD